MLLNITDPPRLFSAEELETIERRRVDGISSREVISLFQDRGIKLSEATFRKYVQLGLLPTSRRVGKKGKHRGSQGVYPVSVVRRINLIKRMMMEDMTLEEIHDSFISVLNEKESVQLALDSMFEVLEGRIGRLQAESKAPRSIEKELVQAQKEARKLMQKVELISSRLAIVGSPSDQEEQGGLP